MHRDMLEKKNHSIKVPRLYKVASKIAKEVKENGGNLKQLIYSLQHCNIKALYALVVETLHHGETLDSLLKGTQMFDKEKQLDPWLARVLITELLWGKQQLPAVSKPLLTVLAYEAALHSELKRLGSSACPKHEKARKPRYVRINTLSISIEQAVRYFEDEGWCQTVCSAENYTTFLSQVSQLSKNQFARDFHLEEVLVFPAGTEFHQHELYHNGSILLQDKATCLSAYLLAPTPGSIVLDMCAAPGMKTLHVAAVMNNKGVVYAVEQNWARYNMLCQLVKKAGVSCVKTMHGDSTKVTPEQCPGVEYILVDPSCSGSGFPDRAHESPDPARVRKLAAFQATLLHKALTDFPDVRRVVYSTCSLLPEENEQVVEEALNKAPAFQLAQDVLSDSWPNRGSPEYSCGPKCLYARPETDLTVGFFIAVFEKADGSNGVEGDFERSSKRKRRKKRDVKNAEIVHEDEKNNHSMQEEIDCRKEKTHKKHKKEKKEAINTEIDHEDESNHSMQEEIECGKERKHKKKKKRDAINTEIAHEDENKHSMQEDIDCGKERKHKKHKKKEKRGAINAEIAHEDKNNHSMEEEIDCGMKRKHKKHKKKEKRDAINTVIAHEDENNHSMQEEIDWEGEKTQKEGRQSV